MLIANKVQNLRDVPAHSRPGTHPEYEEPVRYFDSWMEALEISDEKFVEMTSLLPPALQPLLEAMIAAAIPETLTYAEQEDLTAEKEQDIRIARGIVAALPDGPLATEAWVWLLPGALSQVETPVGFRGLAYRWFDGQFPVAASLPEIAATIEKTQAPFLRDLATRLRLVDAQEPRNRRRALFAHSQSLVLYLATHPASEEVVIAFRQLRRLA